MTNDNSTASVVAEFMTVINMSSDALRAWLNTSESRAVDAAEAGDASDASDASVARGAGLRTIALLKKSRHEYTEVDVAHARNAVAFIRRHVALRPDGDVTQTPWRYALMNVGCDPMRLAR